MSAAEAVVGDGQVTARQLAVAFARQVRAALTRDQLAEVRRRNDRSVYAGCCATHDFVDANMCMLAAYAFLADEEEGEVDLEAAADVMNEAWAIAKAAGFREEAIK